MFNLDFRPGLNDRGYFCNTWGLNSINSDTFGRRPHTHTYGLGCLIVTMKVAYFVLDVLGYIPGISTASGAVRVGLAVVSGIGVELGIKFNAIIGPYIAEARGTIRAQILRGILEMIPFYGKIINATLDVVHTPTNLAREVAISCNPYYGMQLEDD